MTKDTQLHIKGEFTYFGNNRMWRRLRGGKIQRFDLGKGWVNYQEPMILKCSMCKDLKPKNEFHKSNTLTRGFDYWCKKCRSIYESKLRKGSPKRKAMQAAIYKSNREERRNYRKKWDIQNKHKVYAHNSVRLAVLKGILIKKPCEICGEEPSEAHHDDYSKPLDVLWLCVVHHRRRHRSEWQTV